jgi:hypothetical protein
MLAAAIGGKSILFPSSNDRGMSRRSVSALPHEIFLSPARPVLRLRDADELKFVIASESDPSPLAGSLRTQS